MDSHANWSSVSGIATKLLDGNPIAIAVTIFIAFGLPVLLHLIFYRTVATPPSSNFLLLGPSGAGKTALLSLVSRPVISSMPNQALQALKDEHADMISGLARSEIISPGEEISGYAYVPSLYLCYCQPTCFGPHRFEPVPVRK